MDIFRGSSWSHQVHIPICVSSRLPFLSTRNRQIDNLGSKTSYGSYGKSWKGHAVVVCLFLLFSSTPPVQNSRDMLQYLNLFIFYRFDYYSFDIQNRTEDEEGLLKAVNWINELISIEETQHNIPPERIIIGGLSQGGAVALLTSITIKKPLAGLFALSTYVPLRGKVSEVFFFPSLSVNCILKVLISFHRYSPHSRNGYPSSGVTEWRTYRLITNFPSSALRRLHPNSEYPSDPTNT